LDNCIALLHHTEMQKKNKFQTEFLNFKMSNFGKTSGNCTNEPLKCVTSLFPSH